MDETIKITDPIPTLDISTDNVTAVLSILPIKPDDLIVVQADGLTVEMINNHSVLLCELLDKAGYNNPVLYMNTDSYIMAVNDASSNFKNIVETLIDDNEYDEVNNSVSEDETFSIDDVLRGYR